MCFEQIRLPADHQILCWLALSCFIMQPVIVRNAIYDFVVILLLRFS